MKEVKKVLSAALAATLATGALGTVAGAAPVDDLYKAAYDATLNALNKKDQDAINAARVAIDKLPAELQGYKGEFSKQVDTVQHPILVTIVDSINNAEKTLKQVDINTARKAIPANLPEVWRNSYSAGVDATQQKLINKTVEAANKALDTGKKADLDAAKALLNELKSVENNDTVKAWVTTYEKEFTSKVKLTVDGVEVLANDTIKVNFTREVDAKTVVVDAFKVSNINIASVKTSSDKMSVEVKFSEKVTEGKEYTVDVKDLKDLNGNAMVAAGETFVYAKADSRAISMNKTIFAVNEDVKNSVVVKDNLGRDITKDVTISFETSDASVVNAKGVALALGKAVITPVAKDNDGNVVAKGEKVAVEVQNLVADQYEGYSVYKDAKDLGPVYSKFDKTVNVKKGTNDSKIAFFFKDQNGAEMTSNASTTFTVKENMNSSIATLDATGTINAITEGTAYFKVEMTINNKVVEKVISVSVVGESAVSTVELDKTSVACQKGATTVKQEIKLTVKDQYGDKYKREKHAGMTENVRLFVKNASTGKFVNLTNSEASDVAQYSDIALSNNAKSGSNLFTDGETTIKVNASALGKVGSNTYKVQYELKDGDTVVSTVEKELTVDVREQGNFAGYNVEKVTSLEKYDDTTTTDDEREGTFRIEELSTNGAVQNYITAASVFVVDKNGVETTLTSTSDKFTIAFDATTNKFKLRTNGCDAGQYTVKVKVGTSEIANYSLTVNETSRIATVVEFKETGLVVAGPNTTASMLNATLANLKGIVTVKDQNGKEIDKSAITSVVATDCTIAPTKNEDGTYNVTIKKVNITTNNADIQSKQNVAVSITLTVRFN